jgi:hypothetical protein
MFEHQHLFEVAILGIATDEHANRRCRDAGVHAFDASFAPTDQAPFRRNG